MCERWYFLASVIYIGFSVLKCMLRRFAFLISSMQIGSLIFKGGIDDLSWVDMNDFKVFHKSLLLILRLDFNLLARLSKYDFL